MCVVVQETGRKMDKEEGVGDRFKFIFSRNVYGFLVRGGQDLD
jgi:hypothetical protein